MLREPAIIDLEMRPTLEVVPIVGRFVEHFFAGVTGHADGAARMALAAHELLENTAKFAVDGRAKMRIAFVPVARGTLMSLRTVNRALDRDRDNAVELLQVLTESSDPGATYHALMLESARRRHGSGLGLARVWVEAGMAITFSVAGETITLDASAVLPDEARAVKLSSTMSAEFGAVHAVADGVLTVNMTGSADASAVEAIERLLPRIHEEVLRLGLGEVVVDLTQLELMTSSCFKSFVTWIIDVSDLPNERQYRIRLRGSPGILWQRRSLHALKSFGDTLVEVEGVGSS
jgi:hypothetical protein